MTASSCILDISSLVTMGNLQIQSLPPRKVKMVTAVLPDFSSQNGSPQPSW